MCTRGALGGVKVVLTLTLISSPGCKVFGLFGDNFAIAVRFILVKGRIFTFGCLLAHCTPLQKQLPNWAERGIFAIRTYVRLI